MRNQARLAPTEKGKRDVSFSASPTVTKPTNFPGSVKFNSKLSDPVG